MILFVNYVKFMKTANKPNRWSCRLVCDEWSNYRIIFLSAVDAQTESKYIRIRFQSVLKGMP